MPNLTIGAPVVKSLRKPMESLCGWRVICSSFLDCHLMVENPERYITPLKEAGANMFNFHIEAASNCFVE